MAELIIRFKLHYRLNTKKTFNIPHKLKLNFFDMNEFNDPNQTNKYLSEVNMNTEKTQWFKNNKTNYNQTINCTIL